MQKQKSDKHLSKKKNKSKHYKHKYSILKIQLINFKEKLNKSKNTALNIQTTKCHFKLIKV